MDSKITAKSVEVRAEKEVQADNFNGDVRLCRKTLACEASKASANLVHHPRFYKAWCPRGEGFGYNYAGLNHVLQSSL